MTTGRWWIAMVSIVIMAVIGLLIWVWRNPLALYERTTRRALAEIGLERAEMEHSGGRLVYWQEGQGSNLVLLHGSGDQAGAWARVARGLAGSYRVLIPDLPGHGESDPGQGPLRMAEIYGGLEAFLGAHASDGAVILVGNSMGAWLAMLYAHRHPEAVARVVAVNGGPVRGEPTDLTLTPRNRQEARRVMEALRDPSSPRIPDYVLDDIVRRAASGPIGRLMQDIAGMEQHLLDGRLDEITAPVDLLWGESDRLVPVEYAERMAAELPRVRLTLIPTCGHVPQNECPERFLEALQRTLAASPPATSAPSSQERPPSDAPLAGSPE